MAAVCAVERSEPRLSPRPAARAAESRAALRRPRTTYARPASMDKPTNGTTNSMAIAVIMRAMPRSRWFLFDPSRCDFITFPPLKWPSRTISHENHRFHRSGEQLEPGDVDRQLGHECVFVVIQPHDTGK